MSQPVHLERKTVGGSTIGLLVGVAITVLNGVNGAQLLGSGLPTWAQGLITTLAPPLAVFLTQYALPHTSRPDLSSVVPAPTPDAVVLDAEPA